jgi:hypothetical protein
MPPEYIQKRAVTPAFDVYQCGLLLVEMLTGVPVVNQPEQADAMRTHALGALKLPACLLGSSLGDWCFSVHLRIDSGTRS